MLKRLALTLLLIAPSFAWSEKFYPDITLDKIGNIEVVIRDGAVDGCWTNIKEVKNYAEGKLEIAGAKLFGQSGMGFGDLFKNIFTGIGGFGMGFNGSGIGGGQGGGLQVFGRLSGSDILISSERAGRDRTRLSGITG